MEETFGTVLRNFGVFGLALSIVGSGFWGIWKWIIEPQQKEAREDRNRHIQMMDKIIENHDKMSKEHTDFEKENIKVLQGLNGIVSAHNQKMRDDHERILDDLGEIKRDKK